MQPRLLACVVLLAVAILPGCNDADIDYPIGDGGWHLVLNTGQVPTVGSYPVYIEIEGQVINLTDGGRPQDGAILLFSTSGGSYENGLTEIEKGMAAGKAVSTLQIDGPGRYEVSVEYVDQSCTVSTTVEVWL
jgi:hypothetical protein